MPNMNSASVNTCIQFEYLFSVLVGTELLAGLYSQSMLNLLLALKNNLKARDRRPVLSQNARRQLGLSQWPGA